MGGVKRNRKNEFLLAGRLCLKFNITRDNFFLQSSSFFLSSCCVLYSPCFVTLTTAGPMTNCRHLFRAIIFMLIANSDASEISSGFANLATRAKLLSIPISLRNETNATMQLHKLLINRRNVLIKCITHQFEWNSGTDEFGVNEGCSFFRWTLVWTFIGLMMILVLLMSCVGFGAGRIFLGCCCKPCGCAQCGGIKPTTTYSVAWVVAAYIIYFVLLLSLFSLMIIGSLVFFDAIDNLTNTVSVVSAVLDSLSSLTNRTALKTWGLVPETVRHVGTLNDRFNQLEIVSSSSVTFYQALYAVLIEAEKLAFLIEGCLIGQCNSDSVCSEYSNACGSATLLDSCRVNPECPDLNGSSPHCPCCANCSSMVRLVESARSNIPLNWTTLDRRIPIEEVTRAFHAAANDTQTALEKTMLLANAIDSAFWYFRFPVSYAEKSSGLLFGIIWAPGWFVLFMLVVGMCMAPYKGSKGTRGQYLIWTVFAIGVLWVCIVLLPLFAMLSIFSIPLSSTCNSLARAHEVSYLREVFGNSIPSVADGPESNTTDIIIDCLLLDKSVAKYYSNDLEAAFRLFQSPNYQISSSVMNLYFSIETQAAPFKYMRGSTAPNTS